MTISPLEALPIDQLRLRSSTKWRKYTDDVLPLFVAETDFPLAPLITERLRRAVELGDTGYTPPEPGVKEAFAHFARRRFGWDVRPEQVRTTCDVMMGVVELLRIVMAPGERFVITPPVYPPFFDTIREAGGEPELVPLLKQEAGWRLDLPGIEAALSNGARGVLLCNPHNPTGTAHTREDLAALADIVARHGGTVISDEIHAPLIHPGAHFTPFLTASETAGQVGFALTSASKAFNLAGLKCALMVTASPEMTARVDALPPEVEWRTGLFGALAAVAAFDERSDAWLDALRLTLDGNRRLLTDLLAEHLPGAKYEMPDAGYLAWVDVRELGWGDNPAVRILRDAKVALGFGPTFGQEGKGHIRINLGCSPAVLREAIERIGALR